MSHRSPASSHFQATPQSARPLSGHRATANPPAFVDHNPTGYPPSVAPPPNDLSPSHPHYPSPYPTANSVTRTQPVSPLMYSQPMYTPQPSTSTHQHGRSTYRDNSFAEHPVHRIHPGPYHPTTNIPYIRQPLHLAPRPFPLGHHSLPHPDTYSDRPTSRPFHSLPDSQSRRPMQSSISIHRLEYSTHQMHLPPISTSLSPGQLHHPQGMFSGSHNLSFLDNTFIDNSTTSDNFMKEFLQHTIIGAEYDSSARYPPPQCHPGTRLAIVQRCKVFIDECNGKEKMRWVLGPVGVGKSAIMQMVAEEAPADASVFFSVNGRQDGTKTFTTIAYQLATKCEPYRQFLRDEITRDPSLLRKLLPAQFNKFIVEPFIHRNLFDPSRRFVIIVDGLDECDNPLMQQQLLELISEFCISYPSSPLVWFVASRPEPQITSFFDDVRVAPAYTKEEIEINSDEACQDVQRYLHDELNQIKSAYPTLKHKREWLSELEFTKIATAAGGLFAYASTVVRYIGDLDCGDPVSRLGDVLAAIDTGPNDTLRRNNPLALLDALYERILSNVPDGAMINAKKLLLIHSDSGSWPLFNFRQQCNMLGLTEDAAYGAIRHLHAVVKVPEPDKADHEPLEYFHKSFDDFLLDFKRSGFSRNVKNEVRLLEAQSSLRIIEQVPNIPDGTTRRGIECYYYGYLKDSPGFCDKIPLSWPGDERFLVSDDQLRLGLYRDSMRDICNNFLLNNQFTLAISHFHALTTRFTTLSPTFPFASVRRFLFDKFRHELVEFGQLKQVPLRALDYAAICGSIVLRFTSPVGMNVKHSDPWNPICKHEMVEQDHDDLQHWRGWETSFENFREESDDCVAHTDIQTGKDCHWNCGRNSRCYQCLYCSRRFACQFIDSPDRLATVFVDSTEMCYGEVSFVDPDDGASEWRYRFLHSGSPSV